MKKIKLTKGKYALVDDGDFNWLNQWKWWLNTTGYAYTSMILENEGRKKVFMHRFINKTPSGLQTDHINRNRLDNRRNNLRTVTPSQNNYNLSIRSDNKSGYKGVVWRKTFNRWVSYINVKGIQVYLGCFKNKSEAIQSRKKGELLYRIYG